MDSVALRLDCADVQADLVLLCLHVLSEMHLVLLSLLFQCPFFFNFRSFDLSLILMNTVTVPNYLCDEQVVTKSDIEI